MLYQWFADRILRKSLKNAGWLLGSRIITGLASLLYLGLVTRSLGVTGFGTLVLIQTYIQVIIDLTTFQSSQAVIRYGVISLQQNDLIGFQKLVKFTTLLDLLGALIGFAIAFGFAPVIGSFMSWDEEMIRQVQGCSLLILLTLGTTPKGILQLGDRFDLLAFQATVPALVRLGGTIIAFSLNASLEAYLLAWFASYTIAELVLIGYGWQEARRKGWLEGLEGTLINLTQPHPGLLKFCIVSNLNSSLPIVMRQSSPLVIGWAANPIAVGLFQVAWELSTPLKDLAQLLTQSFYPEFASLNSQTKRSHLKTLLIKSTVIAIAIGLIILVISVCFGQMILHQSFGVAFVPAYRVLILLVVSEVFAIASSVLESALFAIGCPNVALRVNAIAILGTYLPLLLVLTQFFGILGAGFAVCISTALILGFEGLLTWQQLQQRL